MTYDSRVDTYKHIKDVGERLGEVIENILHRCKMHDTSKLSGIEKEAFDRVTPILKGLTYGSDEYRASLREIKPALEHHYKNNSHHPEYYENGIRGMSLLDLIEMLCDWSAAVMRHADGDLMKSVEMSQKRFGYSDELKDILYNTIRELQL